ncbi:MAG: DUF721 domain-containing protein [Desulfovibrio sp.]|uniref:DUF721 domain-containing protein n=1 Tax=Desulfovibrio sp. 7SRBS1 TaxID=3378064 RepID=UPI003B3D6498
MAWLRFRPDKVRGFREGKPTAASSLVGPTLGPDTERRFALVRLWRDWPRVVDPAIAEMVHPLKTRKGTLVLGAHDSLVMQEIHFLAPEILQVVNEFLGEEFFDKVVFELISGKIPLARGSEPKGNMAAPKVDPPGKLGTLQHLLESDSAIGRSYRAYVRRFAGKI